MGDLVIQLVVAATVMGVLDAVWLGTVAKQFYYGELGAVLLKKPNMKAAVLFYIIYVVGTVVFVTMPALKEGSLAYAAGFGALFGFVAYATYDLTNLATMKGFKTKVAVVDMIWGAALTSVVASVTFLIVHR